VSLSFSLQGEKGGTTTFIRKNRREGRVNQSVDLLYGSQSEGRKGEVEHFSAPKTMTVVEIA